MSQPKTVVLHVFGRMDRGGAEMRSVEMLRHLDPNCVRTIYCTLARDDRPGMLDEEIRALNAGVVRCPLTRGFGIRFRRLLRAEHVTAMHSHVQFFSGLLVFYAWLEQVPVRIAHWHTTGRRKRSIPKRIQDAFMRMLIQRFATRIVSVGHGAMKENWPGADSDPRCRVLRTGIDLTRFENRRTSAEIRAELGIPQDAFVLVHIGRFNPVKNQLRLLSILTTLQQTNTKPFIVFMGGGEGGYEEKVRETVQVLGFGESVRFLGSVKEVAEYLPAGDVMVFPSEFEGLPGSVLEAMAAGVPVLATALPGVAEIQQELPQLQSMSLDKSDEEWTTAAVELAQRYSTPEQKSKLKAALANSSFNLQACIKGHIETWEGR